MLYAFLGDACILKPATDDPAPYNCTTTQLHNCVEIRMPPPTVQCRSKTESDCNVNEQLVARQGQPLPDSFGSRLQNVLFFNRTFCLIGSNRVIFRILTCKHSQVETYF